MSVAPSILKERMSKYFGYNNNNNNNNNNNKMNCKNNNNNDIDTRVFDKIDYIVQLPITANPSHSRTRFLLAMDYNLPARNGLGVMDTALEHIMHYYDMRKVELIFLESFNSVCLFLEFINVSSCTTAYIQLFQFFKTVFYVQNLENLQERWICCYCKHYNSFDNTFNNTFNPNKNKNKINKINKRKEIERIYWCSRCKEVNDRNFKKIKYIYLKKDNNNNNNEFKSNRDQIASISKQSLNKINKSKSYNKLNVNNVNNDNDDYKRRRSSTDPHDDINNIIINAKSHKNNININNCNTNGANNMLMGHAQIGGRVLFKNNQLNIKSKSMNQIIDNNKTHSASSSVTSIASIASSSQVSVASVVSSVSSIAGNLDLCLQILENIENETLNKISPKYNNNNNNNNHILSELKTQKTLVQNKIHKLYCMLSKIDAKISKVVDVETNEMKQQQQQPQQQQQQLTSGNLEQFQLQKQLLCNDDDDDNNNNNKNSNFTLMGAFQTNNGYTL